VLVEVVWNAPSNPTKATRHIKVAIHRLFGDKVILWANRVEKGKGEYLVDVSLTSRSRCKASIPKDYQYDRLLFAGEIEWKPLRREKGEYDFAKLADVRADRKAYVGMVKKKDWLRAEGILADMLVFLNHHALVPKGEEYAVVLWSPDKKAGDCIGAWILRKGARSPNRVGQK
jgi:hypothetical protein